MSETPRDTYDLVFRAGDTETRTFTWTEDDGTPIDLTGYTAELTIGNRKNDPNATTYTSDTSDRIEIADAAAGQVTTPFTRADTRTLGAKRKYYYEVTVVSAGGQATTLSEGLITMEPEVGE